MALQFKRLWMVEACFRSTKSLLQTRPIYHKCYETIRGHVFCSFLALVCARNWRSAGQGWSRLRVGRLDPRLRPLADGGSLAGGKRFLLRSEVQGTCGTVFLATGSPCRRWCSRPSQIPPPQSQILLPRRAWNL